MTERELEQRLRGYYRTKFGELAAPGALRASVTVIPDEMPAAAGLFRSRRGIVLLAAALLTALIVGGAVAIGAGLLRLPFLPDRPQGLPAGLLVPPSGCSTELPDGVVVAAEGSDGSSDAPSDPRLFVYPDGTVLRGPDFVSTATSWMDRQLTADGLAALIAAVQATDLIGCRDVPIEGPGLLVAARTEGGDVLSNLGGEQLKPSTAAERAAAMSLARRLRDPDFLLGPGSWAADWTDFALDRFEVRIRLSDIAGAGEAAVRLPWSTITLPDGSTVATMGDELVPPPDDGDTARCAVASADVADALAEALGRPVDPGSSDWEVWDDAGAARVGIGPLLPHEPGCDPDPVLPSAPKPSLGIDLGACDYLGHAVIQETLGKTAGNPRESINGDWSACEYFGAESNGWTFASRRPVSARQVAELVEAHFGSGIVAEEVAGGLIFANSCFTAEATCSPAVAAFAEPHFVLILWDSHSETEMRVLARAVIDHLR